jgi:anti-sigma factor RsiW
MKRCKDFRMLLSPWLDQEISTELRTEVDAHLASCRVCAAELEALRTIDLLLDEPVDEIDLSARVLSEIRIRRPGLSWWLRTAAAVIASVGIGLAAGGAIDGNDRNDRNDANAQASTESVAVLAMIDDHFSDNALHGIGDLARDLERGAGQ